MGGGKRARKVKLHRVSPFPIPVIENELLRVDDNRANPTHSLPLRGRFKRRRVIRNNCTKNLNHKIGSGFHNFARALNTRRRDCVASIDR